MKNKRFTQSRWSSWGYGLFWSWNLIFLAFMVLGFAPRLLPELLTSVRAGIVPLPFLFYGLALTSIPLIAIILGLTVFRRAPARLFALGYAVEGPLMLMLAIRFFLIRQAPPGLNVLLGIATLGMAAFLWQLLKPKPEEEELAEDWPSWLRLAGLTLMLLTSVYASIWIAFYAVPLAGAIFQWLIDTLRDLPGFFHDLSDTIGSLLRENLIWIPFSVLGFLLLIYTLTLFALAPVVFPLLGARAWGREMNAWIEKRGWLLPTTLVTATIVVTSAIFILANRQPQQRAFELLSEPPKSSTKAQELLKQRQAIRSGLLNAYLAPYRYISAQGEVRHVRDIYESVFDMQPADALAVERVYEGVASPLLYNPVHVRDDPSALWRDNQALVKEPQEAAQLYQQFFDQPIDQGEREALVEAARNTWSSRQAEAAWLAVDDREVYLQRQELTIQERGDWAQVELYEVYQNRTTNNQEVIYYFNLPESAVLTGLWLGESPDRSQRFAFQVSPRGAAQTLYQEETRRSVDPALLEQIGPRQYRLRAYPVPPMVWQQDDLDSQPQIEEAPPMHLWLTYQVMAQDGEWPLPQMAYKLNVFWDGSTQRLLNGEPLSVDGDAWLPVSIPASTPTEPVTHRVDLPGGESVLALPAAQAESLDLPDDLRLAVVLDRSASMEPLAEQVSAALARLGELPASATDVYLTASPYRGENPSLTSLEEVQSGDILYFGGQNPAELLAQFDELRAGREYDAVIVLTDSSAYELGKSPVAVQTPDVPVWMVHLASELPLGYDDPTLEAIQASGGGVAGNLDAALTRLAYSLAGERQTGTTRDLLDGYEWITLPTAQADSMAPGVAPHAAGDGFAALAARRYILAEMQRQRGDLKDLETLDRIHAIAVENAIVTPYSSMIVLVNVGQQMKLNALEARSNRFDREYEELGETTPPTRQMPLTGVPEPHEWLLIILAAGMLAYYAYTKRDEIRSGVQL
jgi:putative PEP-CTERM system integral membrane protein